MPVEQLTHLNDGAANLDRPLWRSMRRGFACKCPNCGEGDLFAEYLKTHDHCEACGEALFHHRADDLPAYLNIFIVGHVVIGFMMIVMSWKLMGMWTTMFVTIALCLVVAFLLMRPLKGMILGSQWALGMHGFGGDES
jgi:uncharacterized protein (DUF983 family)